MLDDFNEKYKIAYKILNNDLKKERNFHAYLFELNGNIDGDKLIMAFVKSLLCPFHYTNYSKCDRCNQCENIENNNYLEVKIIQPDGMWIKKEQLLMLQEEFKTKGIENKKRIYIIKNAEKMNSSAANSILKFLEEPQNNIIAILSTDNIHQLLQTIVSRCKVIVCNNNSFNDDSLSIIQKNYDKDQFESIILNTIQFVEYLEKYKYKTIAYEKKIFFNIFSDKEDIVTFFELLLFFYKDLINIKLNRKCVFSNISFDKFIVDRNSIDDLNKKIDIVLQLKEKIKVNANINLLIDRLIIEIGDV